MPSSNGQQSIEPSASGPLAWLKAPALYCSAIFCVSAIIFYGATSASFYRIWLVSETYAHGFLIVPIVCWLVWNRRSEMSLVPVQPCYFALLPMACAGCIWLIGNIASVQVVQQICFIFIFIGGLWTILGSALIRVLAFPLGFLFFAVPMGEELVPVMMEFTASFTIWLLQLTGIPVYREGLHFSIPSGNWSVVEACSGVRYLIASVTLGTLYAYLTFHSFYKRCIFIVVSMLMPILANGVRAYIIVMLGHLSDMKLATGVDHLIYGWVFFGFVMFLLFAVGSLWRDPDELPDSAPERKLSAHAYSVRFSAIALATCCALMAAAFWPAAGALMRPEIWEGKTEIAVESLSHGWEALTEAPWEWRPVNSGADAEYNAIYRKDMELVSGSIAVYRTQRQGSELINPANRLISMDSQGWHRTGRSDHLIELDSELVSIDQSEVRGQGHHLLVWHWYRVGKYHTSNQYFAKFYEVLNRVNFGRADAARIALATPVETTVSEAEKVLGRYIEEVWPTLETSIDRAVGANP